MTEILILLWLSNIMTAGLGALFWASVRQELKALRRALPPKNDDDLPFGEEDESCD